MFIKLIEVINSHTSKILKKHYGINRDNNKLLARRRKKSNGVKVSDHALLRYFERMEGYNMEDIIKRITNGVNIKSGIRRQTIGDMTLILDNDTIVTLFKYELHNGNKIRFMPKKDKK